jgi:peptidyl-prolyl cis-trans isomerase SurA
LTIDTRIAAALGTVLFFLTGSLSGPALSRTAAARHTTAPAGVSAAQPAAAQPAGSEPLLSPENASDGVAAVVNDSIITDYDLRQRVGLFLATSGVKMSPERLKQIRVQVLTQLETERLEMLEATKNKISVSTSEVDRAINNILTDNHLSMDQLKTVFAKGDVDMSTFRGQLAAQIAWSKAVDGQYGDEVHIQPQQVDSEMQRLSQGANKTHFRVSEIFEAVDNPEQDPQILKNVQGLLEQIRAGAPFDAVARQFSQNPTAAAGGDIGTVQQGQLVPELDAVLQKMKPGDVSEPIKASGGYYLLELRARYEPAGTKVPESQQVDEHPTALTLERILLPIGPKPGAKLLDGATQAASVLRQHIAGCDSLQELVSHLRGAVLFNLGKMDLSQVSAQMRDAVAKTNPGDTTEPFQSPAGIELIVRCDAPAPHIEVWQAPKREEVENQLYEEQMSVYARRYLRDLKRVANIETPEDRALKNVKSSSASIR